VSQPQPIDDLIRRFVEGTAPQQVRAAAARGALPLPRTVLTQLFVLLLGDEVEQIRNDARNSLGNLSNEALQAILADPACAPVVLDHFAARALADESIAEQIVFHDATPDSALESLAAKGNAAIIDLILTNEERLLTSPRALNFLTHNSALRADQRARIMELVDTATRMQERAEAEAAEVEAEEDEYEDLPADPEEAARILEVDVGELLAASEIMGGEEFEQSEVAQVRSAYRRIVTLNAGQRAILAMKGGREERLILVRDTNKIVSLSVLRNPRLNDLEVERIAAMRNVSSDVLRAVGTNREWSKKYPVVLTLVKNPLTPPGVSTNFIPRLQNRDLKFLSTDKNVPEIIRRMSKKTLDMRTQKSSSGFRK
jgi:hypothetical protein